jgi:hypothetical protein
MADVIEVIHKINYEVNDAALQSATNVIIAQIKELNRLNTTLATYQQQLNDTKNLAAFDMLSRKIDAVSKQIEASGSKAKGILSEIAKDVAKSLSVDLLKDTVTSYTDKFKKGLTDVGKKAVEISPILDSLGNAIVKPAKGGTETAAAFATLGTALGAFSGFAPIAISLLAALGGELLESGGALDFFSSKIKNTLTETEKIALSFSNLKERSTELASSELVNVQTLYTTATNINQSYQTRINAVEQLQRLYPEYFGNLSQEAIHAGEAAEQYENLTNAIIKQASISVYKDEIEALAKRKREIERQEEAINFSKRFEQGINSSLPKEATGGQKYNITLLDVKLNKLEREKNYLTDQQKNLSNKIQELIKDIQEATPKKGSSTVITGNKPASNPQLKALPKEEIERIGLANYKPYPVDSLPAPSSIKPAPVQVPSYTPPRIPSRLEKFMFGDTAEEQDPEKRRRHEIEKSISAYTSLVDTAVQAYQTITEAQIKALDKEIEIRQKRVDAATKLAERGNTEALRIEEERLAAAEKKRDEYAKRQAIINSALAVSNAIVAVAEAAAQSGVGAIATVPAVIAAIVAGYAAISAATRESGSFKDGVVDFQGKGTGTSDSNVVRISHGESVITAAGTQRNKEVLEAINRGAVFNMLQPSIKPMYMPAATQGMGGYASRGELKGLEKKMDTLIDTVAANGTTVHARMDERGMSLMTVKQIRREHNRFK